MKRLEEWKVNYIKDNVNKMSREKIAEQLDISIGTVQNYVQKNQWYTRKTMFSLDDIEYMKEHYLDMTYKEIGNQLGFTERQIRGKINHMNLSKKREVKDDYFEIIDSSLKAYFLGFIFADGYVVYNEDTRNYEMGMELQIQDKYILEELNKELGGNNVISIKPPTKKIICNHLSHVGEIACLRVYSKRLVQSLIKQGVECNKSLKDICPLVEDKFFFDWLRGYIDGDGCYYLSKAGILNMHITCGSKKVLETIQSRLRKFNIETHIYTENDKKYRLMCIKKTEIEKLLRQLYYSDDLFYLTRKYNIVNNYLNGSAV